MQLALFGRERQARFDPTLTGLARIALDDGGDAFVEHLPGWLSGHATLLDELIREVPWEKTTQLLYERVVDTPRLVASLTDHTSRWPILDAMARALTTHCEYTFDAITAAYYRDGNDSVAWHRDRNLREKDRGCVATVSLGEPRPFLLRPRGGGAPSKRLMLGHGDLVIMGGTCQRTWEHTVPKSKSVAGPRIAVMFRRREVD